MRDTLPAEPLVLRRGGAVTYPDESPAPPDEQGFKIAVAIIGFMLLAAALFTVYLLAWDGGG